MTPKKIAHPPIVSQEEWCAERVKLLTHEKELTKQGDKVNAERRRLPMVKIEKEYAFDGTESRRSLKELFDGRQEDFEDSPLGFPQKPTYGELE